MWCRVHARLILAFMFLFVCLLLLLLLMLLLLFVVVVVVVAVVMALMLDVLRCLWRLLPPGGKCIETQTTFPSLCQPADV